MVSLLPGLIGGLVGYFTSRRRVFDLESGWYWKGPKPRDAIELEQRKDCTRLANVYALQIVHEIVRAPRSGTGSSRSSGSTFYSYELNLVLNDGSRINVVDHGNIDAIHSDAARLSEFLWVPVWDATLTLPTYECSASAKGCALLLGTVVGGMVLFVIGAVLLLALGTYLDRQIGNGFLWIALLLSATCGSILIIGRMIRRERRSRRESRAQDVERDAFSPGWTYSESQLHDNPARDHSVASPHAEATPALPNSNCDEPNANSLPADVPYDVDKRPMPDGENLERLLPERVGSFQRGRIRAGRDLYREPIYVEYTAGQHAVEMELGVCRSPEDAQQAVHTSIAESVDVEQVQEALCMQCASTA